MGGQIQMMFGDFLVTLPQVKAGRIRALAVTSLQRHPLLPDVPTVAESGYPGFEALSWQGMFAPAGTPPAIVAKLNAELVKAINAPDMKGVLCFAGILRRRQLTRRIPRLRGQGNPEVGADREGGGRKAGLKSAK